MNRRSLVPCLSHTDSWYLPLPPHKQQVVLFTASHPSYANPLLDILDADRKIFAHRLCFDSCLLVDGTYVKDLTVLGRDLSRTAIIDNTPQAFGFHPDNAIPILSWYDDKSDTALEQLLPVLDTLAEARDVRPLLAAKFGVAARAQQAAERAFASALAELSSAATASAAAPPAAAAPAPGIVATSTARAQAQRAAEAAAEAQASAAAARAALLAARQAAAAATETAAKAVVAPPAQAQQQQHPASAPRSKTALIASAVQRAAKRAPSPSLSQSPGGASEKTAPPPQAAPASIAAARAGGPPADAAAAPAPAVAVPAAQDPPELGAAENGEAPVTDGEEEDDDAASATWRSWLPPPVDIGTPAGPQAPAGAAPQEAVPAAGAQPESIPLPRPAWPVSPPPPVTSPPPAAVPQPPKRVRPAGPSAGWLAAQSAARGVAALGWRSVGLATSATAAITSTAVTGASSATSSALGALTQAATTAAGAAKRAAEAAAGVAGAVYAQATAKAAAKAETEAAAVQETVAPLPTTPGRVRQTATVVLPPSQTPRASSSRADVPVTDAAAKQRKTTAGAREALDAAAASSLGDWTSDDGGRSWRSTASQQRRTPLPPVAPPSLTAATPRDGPSPPPLRRAKPSADGSAVVFIGEVRPRSVGLTGPPGSFRAKTPAPVSPRAGGGMVGWTTMDGGRTWRRATDVSTAPSASKRVKAVLEQLRGNPMAQAITVALMALLFAVAAR